MKLIHFPLIAAALFIFNSCKKEFSLELANPPISKKAQFENLVADRKFQLKAFYADQPIDYVQTDDTVKQETNLWPYVSNYLKDDENVFANGSNNLSITQNAMKMPGLQDSVLQRSYAVTEQPSKVSMSFLDYQYNPLEYELYKVGPDYFVLSIPWKNGVTLYSRFEVIGL